jgi:hypothetical protein
MMNNDLRKQIYDTLNLKETDELLDIWEADNKEEWSEAAFEVIKEILDKRGVEIPEQGNFVPDETEDEENEEFTEEETKILDDEHPPVFYDPFEVLKVSGWIEIAAKVTVGFILVYNLIHYSSSRNIISSYFANNPIPFLEMFLTLVLIAINFAVGAGFTYFALIALSKGLRILMEMEFNSRKSK